MEGSTVVTFDTVKPLIDALSGQISVSGIVTFLGAALGACVALAFMWWAGRKALRMLMSAFKKGRLSV